MRSLVILATRLARRLLSLAWLTAPVTVIGLALWSHVGGAVVVAGDSMAPALPRGSLIQPAAIDAEQIHVGDVVTVQADNGVLVTHRVVRVADLPAGRHLELRGDANPTPDPVLVPADAVVGRVGLVIPVAGFVIAMLSGLAGLLSIISLLAAGMLAIWLLEDLEAAIAAKPATAPRVAEGRRAAG
jgi:signal peptidase